jgi:hypothetical protein
MIMQKNKLILQIIVINTLQSFFRVKNLNK